jgi:hypothetical protein
VTGRINGRLTLLLSMVALLIVAVVGWFAIISPQQSKAAALTTQIDDASGKLAATEAFLASPTAHQSAAQLRRLRVAIPDDPRMSDILRQLAWAAHVSGVKIDSITPAAPVPSNGAQAVPIALSVTGHYFRLAKFMHLLRTRAEVKNGKVHASGRLYGIDSISFSTANKGALVAATLALDAFTYGTAPAPVSTTGDTSTTATSTTATGQ